MADVLPFPPTGRFKVYVVDAANPPRPPEGAQALEIKDTLTGETITWGWSHPIVDRETLLDRSWAWAERLPSIIARQAASSE